MTRHEDILADCSEDFRRLHAAIGDAVRARWPDARDVVEYDMAAFAVPVSDPPAAEDWKGTMPREVFIIGPTEKKAGITIHLWHPKEPYLLKQHQKELEEAGFKPMVGCLQWNKKAPLPMDAFAALLDAAKAVP